jgi:hypothetical protein
MKFGDILKDSASGTVFFILGYALGSLYDMLFYQMYRKIDPDMNHNTRLIPIVLVQLFVLIFLVIFLTSGGIILGVELLFMRVGLVSSQIFLLQWTLKKLVDQRPIFLIEAKKPENTGSHDNVPY